MMEKFHLVARFRTWSEAWFSAVSLENDILLLNPWGEPNINDICRLVSIFAPFLSLKVYGHSLNNCGYSLKIYEILKDYCRISKLVGLSELGIKTRKFANFLKFKVTWKHFLTGCATRFDRWTGREKTDRTSLLESLFARSSNTLSTREKTHFLCYSLKKHPPHLWL